MGLGTSEVSRRETIGAHPHAKPAIVSEVLWRALALLAALVIPLVLMIDALARSLPGPWLAAAIAFGCALPIAFRFAEHRSQALLGAALAGFAGLLAPEVPNLIRATRELESMPVHDLREGPIVAEPGEWIVVRGYLRNEWTLDEYRVAEGERPDQNAPAKAVVVPLLGTEDELVDASEGIVLVARVDPELAKAGGLQTLRGKLVEVAPEIVEALFVMQDGTTGKGRARMLDSFDLPTKSQAWTQAGLLIAAMLLGAGLLVTSVPSVTTRPSPS